LWLILIGSTLNVFLVLLQQEIRVFPADKLGRGDKVIVSFQPFYDLFGSLFIYLPAFRVKFGQYLV
jgi:hypothetical protein